MSYGPHDLPCLARTAAALAEADAFREQWPNHCRTCKGWGRVNQRIEWDGEWDHDPCPDCEGKNRCGRCGGRLVVDAYLGWDGEPCPSCRWSGDFDDSDEGILDPPGCTCAIPESDPWEILETEPDEEVML